MIITTPGGTVLLVLKPVPYVREEVESYVEPEPNQSNYVCIVYGLCGERHCSSCKFYDKVKPLPNFKCAALHTGTLVTVFVNKDQTCFLLSPFIMLSKEAKIKQFGFSKDLFLRRNVYLFSNKQFEYCTLKTIKTFMYS